MQYKKEIEYEVGNGLAVKSVMPIQYYRDECEIYDINGGGFVDLKDLSVDELAKALSDLGDGVREITEEEYNKITGK